MGTTKKLQQDLMPMWAIVTLHTTYLWKTQVVVSAQYYFLAIHLFKSTILGIWKKHFEHFGWH